MIQYHRNVMSDYANVQKLMSITKYHRFVPPLMSKADIPDVFFCDSRGDKALNQQKSMRPFAKLRGGQQVQSCAFHPSKWLDIARHWTCEKSMVTTTGLENLETMGIWKNHGKILNQLASLSFFSWRFCQYTVYPVQTPTSRFVPGSS